MIQTFKDTWHVPVIVNEFGMAYDEVPNAAHVLQQNFMQLEAHGFSSALWDWRALTDTWDQFNLRLANANVTAEVHDYWALNSVNPSNVGFDY